MIKESNFKRMCSFYVSDIHFITMILPYLSEKLEKGEHVITFLEKDLHKELELLLSKINIKEALKNKVRSINWNKTEKVEYIDIENNINSIENNKINIFVLGTYQYIEEVNKNIEKYLSKDDKRIINEIDAYELKEGKIQVKNISNTYKYLLNTSGEYPIKEIIKKKEII